METLAKSNRDVVDPRQTPAKLAEDSDAKSQRSSGKLSAPTDSQSRYRSLFANLQEGCAFCRMIFDREQPVDFVCLEVNEAFAHMLEEGGAKEVVGSKGSEVFPGIREAHPEILEIYGRVAQTGRSERFESFIEPIQKWFLVSVYSDEEGCFTALFEDITGRKRMEAESGDAHELLKCLFDNIPDVIYFKDRRSRFVHYSKSFRQLFKLANPDMLKGKSDFDFFTPEHARPAFEDEQEIIRTGKPMIGKLEKETHPDGRITWALTSKMPWRNQDGDVIGTFGISKDVTAIKEAEAKFEALHKQLLETSRQAGMAEVATSVLHNVGNVLNSVNVSANLLTDDLRRSKRAGLGKAVALMREHQDDLGVFLTSDSRGRQLPEYLEQLAAHLTSEQTVMLRELQELTNNIGHIKEIVAMQQSYAQVAGVAERILVSDLVEDALRMNTGALLRHNVQVVRDYGSNAPEITVDKHKVLQILVNLMRNAKYACDDSGCADKRITLSIAADAGHVRISVADNGIGIPQENLTRIFNHGFTTRKTGHGFGLHSGSLTAKELGGALHVHSDGAGKGARFTLELPLLPKA
jgi:PAS domain S-box-containing protein